MEIKKEIYANEPQVQIWEEEFGEEGLNEIKKLTAYYNKKPFKEKKHIHYSQKYKTFITFFNPNGIEEEIEEEESETYEVMGIKDLLKLSKIKEKPIIKKFLPEKSMSIVFGEPACCKSLLLNYLAGCVSTGTKFLEQYPTKKLAVLFLSSENSEITDSKRFKSIFKGMKINAMRRNYKNLQLLICSRSNVSTLNNELFYEELKDIIRENKIKLILIDTLSPLIADTNDNSGQEIVKIFSNKLFPLIDEFGVSIFASMHSQKSGRDFLGSIKIKASVDVFYELMREDNLLTLLCHKNRNGEHNLKMNITIEELNEQLNKILFSFIEEYSGKQTIKNKDFNASKLVQTKVIVLRILNENEMKWKELLEECKTQGISYSTAKRGIQELYKAKEIKKKKGKSGGYYVA